MGRTITTFNQAAQLEEARWRDFRRALRREDREVFDRLWIAVRKHMQAGQNAARLVPFESMLMAMLLEQQKEILALRARLLGDVSPSEDGEADRKTATRETQK